MNIKRNILTLGVVGIALIASSQAAFAKSDEHCNQGWMSSKNRHEHMQEMLDKFAKRLELKSSQQPAWEEFSKSLGMLSDQGLQKPSDDADAAAIARYQADRASEFSKKMNRIAETTAKLQAVLTEDQRKLLNQASHRFLHREHRWGRQSDEHGKENHY
jgi:hypothetical protein